MDDTDLRDDLARSLEPPPDDAAPMDALDEDRANRMLFKVRRLSRERAQVRAVAAAEMDRVEAWERDRLATLDHEITHLSTTIEAWMRMHSERTKAVTKKLPNGELRLRPGRARLEITDDAKVTEYAVERVMTSIAKASADISQPMGSQAMYALVMRAVVDEPFLRVKVEIAKDAIKKAATEGEISSEHEDVELRRAVLGEGDDAVEIPGVLFERDKRKAFGMTLATAEGPDTEPTDYDDEEFDRGN